MVDNRFSKKTKSFYECFCSIMLYWHATHQTTKKYKTVKLNFVVLKRKANEMLTKNNQKQLKVCYTNQKREKV